MNIARRTSRAAAATVVALTAAVVLTACGGGDDTAAQSGADTSFNVADVGFVQQMIPHHLQAVKMAELAKTRTKNPAVKKLAAQIRAGQQPEIEVMQAWLERWGQPLMAGMPGMDYTQMSPEEMAAMSPGSMTGMATGADISRLSAAKGAKFDRLFLAFMLEHHRGALEMAKAERADGKDADAVALAEDIETTQAGEIRRMKKLQKAS